MSTALDSPHQYDPRLKRLEELVQIVQEWSQQFGWSAQVSEVTLECPILGSYPAPVLEVTPQVPESPSAESEPNVAPTPPSQRGRILLEPVARGCPGTEGVVDLYLMPGRDDIGSFYLYDDEWHIQYIPIDTSTTQARRIRDAMPLDRSGWREILVEVSQTVT
jgi:hypothetical protein